MEPLPHGLWSCSSKPLTGRTGHYRLRDASVYWNHWSTPWIQEYPHYYRTRTHRTTSMTCLVGTPSIEATDPAGTTRQTERTLAHTSQKTDFASTASLRIAPVTKTTTPVIKTNNNHRH